MLTLTERLPSDPNTKPHLTLPLTAEERKRSHHRFYTAEGEEVRLRLPRGTMLQDGDLLQEVDQATVVKIIAKPEPVLTITTHDPLSLVRAAYHLGNRHVPLEVNANYLRLPPDPVLADMLRQMGLTVTEATLPFQPEAGAYASTGHDHSHNHDRKSMHQH